MFFRVFGGSGGSKKREKNVKNELLQFPMQIRAFLTKKAKKTRKNAKKRQKSTKIGQNRTLFGFWGVGLHFLTLFARASIGKSEFPARMTVYLEAPSRSPKTGFGGSKTRFWGVRNPKKRVFLRFLAFFSYVNPEHFFRKREKHAKTGGFQGFLALFGGPKGVKGPLLGSLEPSIAIRMNE